MLKNKVAIVTGGSRGIGRAICLDFAANGADVAFMYNSNSDLADQVTVELLEFGVRAKGYRCDVSDYTAVCETFAQIIKDFETVDILVNNAGIIKDSLLMLMSPENFDAVIDVNLKGAFNLIKNVYPVFSKKRSGRIINISSVSGICGNAGQANYSSSKAGLIGLTKSIAKELAGRGITCNAVAPGCIDTDMTDGTVSEAIVKSIPAKRIGKSDEVAALCTFLASPRAGYITGEVIRIDGGLAI